MAYTVNYCETKEQFKHLGEVVTGKTDGSPTGSDIDTSILSYTGQVRETLPALLAKIGWYSVGEWSSDPLVEYNNQYVYYAANNTAYAPLSLPYQVDSATNPDPETLVGTELKRIDYISPANIGQYTDLVFDVLDDAINSTSLQEGNAVTLKERTAGNGGGAVWDVVLASTVTPNTYDIVQCTGVPTLALVLRTDGGTAIIEQFGAISDPTFDCKPVILAAWARHNVAKFQSTKTFYLGSELGYPSNAKELHGTQSAVFASNTALRPISDGTFTGASLVDMNENGSDSGLTGGQFNKLRNFTIFGGMADWKGTLDPFVGLVGVRGLNTIDECNMENVSFRNCGKPFEFTGFKHNHKSIYVYQCHSGPDFESTNSSSINEYQLQTCYLNWGSYKRVNIHNATVQQGNEQQRLQDDRGMLCDTVNFTGYLYTEGGTEQIRTVTGTVTTVQNWEMGFAILLSGAYGNSNIYTEADSEIYVYGGKSQGVKSFLVKNASAAKTIHLDIEPYDGRVMDSVGSEELPYIDNLFIKRTYGTIKRTDKYNEITLPQYFIGVSTVTIWDQFITPNSSPFGGKIEVQVGGSNSYDRYEVDFSDASAQTEQVTINTIFRNTGGTGDNNIILSYASPNLIAQGRKTDQRLSMKVSGYGSMWPKPIV